MASMKKTTSKAKTAEKKEVVEEKEEKVKKVGKRKFAPDDLIPCMSITPGEMFFIGGKTDELYNFADLNDITEIEYQDLNYAARRKSNMIFKPNFIIKDDDFVKLFPQLEDIYAKLYSTEDLREILDMSANEISNLVPNLPTGAQDALKVLVMTQIDRGRYSDIQKIKAFDDIFNTDMLSRALNAS